jgi:hypothetical protein
VQEHIVKERTTMWRCGAAVIIGALVLLNEAQATEPAADVRANDSRSRTSPAVERIEAAPGGGEMMTLAPDRQYVTRAQVDAHGHLSTQCSRDGAVQRSARREQ